MLKLIFDSCMFDNIKVEKSEECGPFLILRDILERILHKMIDLFRDVLLALENNKLKHLS